MVKWWALGIVGLVWNSVSLSKPGGESRAGIVMVVKCTVMGTEKCWPPAASMVTGPCLEGQGAPRATLRYVHDLCPPALLAAPLLLLLIILASWVRSPAVWPSVLPQIEHSHRRSSPVTRLEWGEMRTLPLSWWERKLKILRVCIVYQSLRGHLWGQRSGIVC